MFFDICRMPQPMSILQPSTENIAVGYRCTSSETSPSSFTGFLATARKEQYASIMSSESLIKARLEVLSLSLSLKKVNLSIIAYIQRIKTQFSLFCLQLKLLKLLIV